MKPSKMFKEISTNRNYLLKVYSIDLLVTLSITIGLFYFRDYSNTSVSIYDLLFLIPAVFFGWLFSSWIHNASHNNFKPPFLNRIAGEISGAWLLYGFTNFILIHILHHKYSDTEKDPVSPEGMSFIVFLSAPMRYMIKRAKNYLRDCHGESEDYENTMFIQCVLFHSLLALRLVFFAALFGPKLFVIFYLPSLFANIAILAHINYACHRNLPNGEIEVVNLNHNLYYKIANFITSGGYYHKNHHINQNLFDPRELKTKKSTERLVTREAQNIIILREEKVQGSLIARYFNVHDIWGEREKNLKNQNKENLSLLKVKPHTTNRS